MVQIDARPPLRGVGFCEQPLDRHLDFVWIAHIGGAVGKDDLETFGQQMNRVRRAKTERGDIITFEQAQNLEKMETTGAGRFWHNHFVPAIDN